MEIGANNWTYNYAVFNLLLLLKLSKPETFFQHLPVEHLCHKPCSTVNMWGAIFSVHSYIKQEELQFCISDFHTILISTFICIEGPSSQRTRADYVFKGCVSCEGSYSCGKENSIVNISYIRSWMKNSRIEEKAEDGKKMINIAI